MSLPPATYPQATTTYPKTVSAKNPDGKGADATESGAGEFTAEGVDCKDFDVPVDNSIFSSAQDAPERKSPRSYHGLDKKYVVVELAAL